MMPCLGLASALHRQAGAYPVLLCQRGGCIDDELICRMIIFSCGLHLHSIIACIPGNMEWVQNSYQGMIVAGSHIASLHRRQLLHA